MIGHVLQGGTRTLSSESLFQANDYRVAMVSPFRSHVPPEIVSCHIPTAFGNVAAIVERPDASGSFPVVFLLHGFTGWKEEEHIVSLAAALRVVGIGSVRFDAPGSGESDGTFYDDYRLTSYIKCMEDVLRWAAQQPHFDAGRFGVWGHSMGGFAAMASGVRYADRLRAVCGSQPSSGKANVEEATRIAWERHDRASFPNLHFRELDLPYAFYLDRDQYDLLKLLPSLHLPVLFLAGTRDALVPATFVQKAFDIANEPKAYREFDVDHFYKKSPRQCDEINDVTVDFFLDSFQ